MTPSASGDPDPQVEPDGAGLREFETSASETVDRLAGANLRERVAVACRGSANPAALAWLAEGLLLQTGVTVVDLGAGLGGPAAWLQRRYGCRVVASDPVAGAVRGMGRLFDLDGVLGEAMRAPFRERAADVSLLLGVVSVVDDPVAALREARRISDRLGLMDYCSTGPATVEAGGSTFLPPAQLREAAGRAGWTIEADVAPDLPAPPSWERAREELSPDDVPDDEADVAHAIERGDIAPRMMLGT